MNTKQLLGYIGGMLFGKILCEGLHWNQRRIDRKASMQGMTPTAVIIDEVNTFIRAQKGAAYIREQYGVTAEQKAEYEQRYIPRDPGEN